MLYLPAVQSSAHFNPRSREGSDLRSYIADVLNKNISIHAPVKGATGTEPENQMEPGISIHAPVKGATRGSHTRHMWRAYFNPRSREGSDLSRTTPTGTADRFQSTLP